MCNPSGLTRTFIIPEVNTEGYNGNSTARMWGSNGVHAPSESLGKTNMEVHNGGQVNGTGQSKERLPKSDVFHVLANDRRRLVLCVLVEQGPCSKRELIDAVAEREFGVPDPPSTERKRVHVSLYQCHLPKLEDYGVIEESQRDEFRLSVNARQVTPYLDTKSLSKRLLPF